MLEGFALYPHRDTPIHSYSKGMRQRIVIIAATLHDPELLVLDEPFSGLDPVNAETLLDILRGLQQAGTTLILFPSTAPQVALDLTAMDEPDGRPLIVAEPPGFALHLWTDDALVTHFGTAEPAEVLARYDPTMQPLVRAFIAERGIASE